MTIGVSLPLTYTPLIATAFSEADDFDLNAQTLQLNGKMIELDLKCRQKVTDNAETNKNICEPCNQSKSNSNGTLLICHKSKLSNLVAVDLFGILTFFYILPPFFSCSIK